MIPIIPNLITFSRLFFLYEILLLLPQYPFFKNKIIALYVLGVLTDALDGYVARKFNMTSEFGKFFDGFIDYIFGAILVIYLFKYGLVGKVIFIPFLIIIFRDTIRNLIRLTKLKSSKSHGRAASNCGKISRVLQNLVVLLVLILPFKGNVILTNQVLIYIALVLSLYSFYQYLPCS
ncbi:CDP-alcohol phosphatidyltransferase [seawater metagenome]|uniref:CDP-alcohol phosphatidyltransferase n=1 Tax=seawater metagenome TaxID=1561972 RepID=A0A5E8CI24_9ZZZZ